MKKNTKYILVQSMDHLKFAKKKFNYDNYENLIWVTTSPYMHNYFINNKYNFINIESLIDLKEYDELMKVVLNNFPRLEVPPKINFINKNDYNIYLKNVYTPYVDTILYKTFLINNFYKKCSGKLIIISSENRNLNFLDKISIENNSINEMRFADYFSRIAKKNFPKVEIIYSPQNSKKIKMKINEIQSRSMGFYEKLLSLLNNNLSTIVYKFFFKLYEKNLIKKFRLNFFKKKKQIVIGSPTDHIEEAFLSLLIRGHEITFLKKNKLKLLTPNKQDVIKEYKNFIDYKNLFIKEIKKNKKINFCKSYLNTITDALFLISYAAAEFKKNSLSIENYAKKLSSDYDNNHILISNYYFNLIDVAYVSYLKKNNIDVVYTEHGPANGITEASKFRTSHYPMIVANKGIYVWQNSLKYIKGSLINHKIYIAGFSNKMTTKMFGVLKRYLIKKILKIKNNKKNICIVADRERNNSMHGPYSENDLLYYQVTRDTVNYFCQKYPNKNICLKLYPTNIYESNYDFADLKEKNSNLKVIRFIDFRFLREIFNEIYVFNGQSGFCWALAANASTFLINKKFQHNNVKEITEYKYNFSIKNVSGVHLLKKQIFKNNNSWINVLE